MTDDSTPTLILEHKIIICAGGQYNNCQSCQIGIPNGAPKHLWRMFTPNHNSWHRGSFWTKHCDECYRRCITEWKMALEDEINSF